MYSPARLATPLHGRGAMESGQISVGLVACTLHPQVLLTSLDFLSLLSTLSYTILQSCTQAYLYPQLALSPPR